MAQSENSVLLFAERVIQEAGTGRPTILGVFDTIDLDDMRQADLWYVFLSIPDIERQTDFELRIELLPEGEGDAELVFQGQGRIRFAPDVPLPTKIDGALPIRQFQPSPGRYAVRFVLGGECTVSRTLTVQKSEAHDDSGD